MDFTLVSHIYKYMFVLIFEISHQNQAGPCFPALKASLNTAASCSEILFSLLAKSVTFSSIRLANSIIFFASSGFLGIAKLPGAGSGAGGSRALVPDGAAKFLKFDEACLT